MGLPKMGLERRVVWGGLGWTRTRRQGRRGSVRSVPIADAPDPVEEERLQLFAAASWRVDDARRASASTTPRPSRYLRRDARGRPRRRRVRSRRGRPGGRRSTRPRCSMGCASCSTRSDSRCFWATARGSSRSSIRWVAACARPARTRRPADRRPVRRRESTRAGGVELAVTSRRGAGSGLVALPFHRVNPRLELDRAAARGFHLDLPAAAPGGLGAGRDEDRAPRPLRRRGRRRRTAMTPARHAVELPAARLRPRRPATGSGSATPTCGSGSRRTVTAPATSRSGATPRTSARGWRSGTRRPAARSSTSCSPARSSSTRSSAWSRPTSASRTAGSPGSGGPGARRSATGSTSSIGPHTKSFMAYGLIATPGAVDTHVHTISPSSAAGRAVGRRHDADHGGLRGAALRDGARRSRGSRAGRSTSGCRRARGRPTTATSTRWSRPAPSGSRSTRTTARTRTHRRARCATPTPATSRSRLHTDGLHERAELEDTVAAIAGRTVHAYHVEGSGGGHVPDLLGPGPRAARSSARRPRRRCRSASTRPSSTSR